MTQLRRNGCLGIFYFKFHSVTSSIALQSTAHTILVPRQRSDEHCQFLKNSEAYKYNTVLKIVHYSPQKVTLSSAAITLSRRKSTTSVAVKSCFHV